ncbi:MAG: hypothetical protein Q8M31_11760 [Beijerinckiaceae bacterium]|nr:hypothetical protein [Beijerinckiaceae bacterium]
MKSPRQESRTRRVMRLHEALDYPCPFCGAKARELCSTANGVDTYEHTARLILRNLVEADSPPDRSDTSRAAQLARKLRMRPAGPRTQETKT